MTTIDDGLFAAAVLLWHLLLVLGLVALCLFVAATLLAYCRDLIREAHAIIRKAWRRGSKQ